MGFIPSEIESYAEAFSTPEPLLLKKLNRDTHAKVLRPRMLSGHLQGSLLAFISRLSKPRRILEVGTYTGYSAICLAWGLNENGLLHTIDHNPELEDFARKYISDAGLKDKVVQHIGEAIEVIPTLDEIFDLVFIDADKENYVNYFEMIYPRLRKGGIVLADNALWGGKVVAKPEENDAETRGIIAFNEHIQRHSGVRNLLLPFRDGLMIAEKL